MNAMMIPLGALGGGAKNSHRESPHLCGLQNSVYDRFFWLSANNTDRPEAVGVAVVLTWETNGYLLWVNSTARDNEGDRVWERGLPTYLPPVHEDAIDRAVTKAQELRALASASLVESSPMGVA